jgi:outer membrane protein OmpA-like peptidoglycan-associated protein
MKKILVIIIFFSLCSNANAQLVLRFAEYKFKNLNYPDAIPYFKYHIERRDSNDVLAIRKLADCYRLTNQYEEAEQMYAKLLLKDSVATDRMYYNDARLRSIRNVQTIDTLNIKVKRLAFNSEISDFAATIYKNKLIFTSSIQVRPFVQRNHTWTETNFLSLQESSIEDDFNSYKPFALELKSKFNIGQASFLERDSTMYYTTNNHKVKSKKNGYINLRIESAEYIYGKWHRIEKFKFNSEDYACAHPSISSDGTKLYFSSNMPGGYGGMDLYVCEWVGDSTWSMPLNLGDRINTFEEEVFPHISTDNILYFASNARNSIGGLDIFYCDFNQLNAKVESFPYPINSSDDDFAFITHPNKYSGFFSSDRGNKGINDDIYSFNIIAKNINVHVVDSLTNQKLFNVDVSIYHKDSVMNYKTISKTLSLRIMNNDFYIFDVKCQGYFDKKISNTFYLNDTVYYIKLNKSKQACHVQGIVKQKANNQVIENVNIKIYNYTIGQEVYNTLSNNLGFYKIYDLESNSRYGISFSKDGYFTKEVFVETSDKQCSNKLITDYDFIRNVELDSIVIGKAIKIDNIYFDLAKWSIRKDAAIELDKIVKMLNENPEIIIELSSHTDSRASAKYNEVLSDKRAKSSAAYIVSKGISESRITGKGYGEYQLINNCADGVKCSEKEHQQNRRTEFKVVGFVE